MSKKYQKIIRKFINDFKSIPRHEDPNIEEGISTIYNQLINLEDELKEDNSKEQNEIEDSELSPGQNAG